MNADNQKTLLLKTIEITIQTSEIENTGYFFIRNLLDSVWLSG